MLSQPKRLASVLPRAFTLLESTRVDMIGVDHQNLDAVAGRRQRGIERDHGAVRAGACADHGHHRRQCPTRAPG